jgi:hypothetical protein
MAGILDGFAGLLSEQELLAILATPETSSSDVIAACRGEFNARFNARIVAEPRLKRVKKSEQRQQLLPGLQVGKQLALL